MQKEAADFFDVVQPRNSDLVNLKAKKLSVDYLINLHTTAAMRTRLDVQFDAEPEAPVPEGFADCRSRYQHNA